MHKSVALMKSESWSAYSQKNTYKVFFIYSGQTIGCR